MLVGGIASSNLRGPGDETFDHPSTLRVSIYAVASAYYCPGFAVPRSWKVRADGTPAKIKGAQTSSWARRLSLGVHQPSIFSLFVKTTPSRLPSTTRPKRLSRPA